MNRFSKTVSTISDLPCACVIRTMYCACMSVETRIRRSRDVAGLEPVRTTHFQRRWIDFFNDDARFRNCEITLSR